MADTGGYLKAAEQLPSLQPEYLTKVAYLLLLLLDGWMGARGWFVVAIQFAALLAAGLALAQFVGERWGDRAGLLSAGVLVLNPQVTQWTKTLFMDPLFIPAVVIFALLLARALEGESVRWALMVTGTLLLFLRPNGLGAVLGAVGILILHSGRLRLVKAALALITVVSVLLWSPAFQTPGGDENTVAARTYEGLVIWVAPDDVRTSMPAPADPSDLSNVALARYALENPVAVARLGLLRVGWELVQVRSHYPPALNALVATQMVIIFFLAALGVRRAGDSRLNGSILAISLGLLLVVAGTWAIAEGRFGWAVFAVWSPWVGIGADRVFQRVSDSWLDRRSRSGLGGPERPS
jgi:4-amino-4-deoxy-L-arabinose transferase-like glycosyltransferase